jgi:transposase
MARTAKSTDKLEWAHELLAQAHTVEQLRQVQALLLPLEFGLSLEQTARAIGRSVAWTSRLRNRLLAGEMVGSDQHPSRGGRRRQNLSLDQERAALAPLMERARAGGILVVGQVKAELEAALGRPMALSSVYNLLHRHGWHKLTPDQRYPRTAPPTQQKWVKRAPADSPNGSAPLTSRAHPPSGGGD